MLASRYADSGCYGMIRGGEAAARWRDSEKAVNKCPVGVRMPNLRLGSPLWKGRHFPPRVGQKTATTYQMLAKRHGFWRYPERPLCRFKGQKSALVKSYFLDAHFFWHRVEGVRKSECLMEMSRTKQPAYVAVISGPEEQYGSCHTTTL